ncbi:MAG TPA: VWA domain-containing protein [Candidatus Limnocylindria bacterium]|nr:VWA domain-containing protein [Candidatus Limnocylindria bacterium]
MIQFTQPLALLLLIPALAWTGWLAWRSDAFLTPWRRWTSTIIRLVVVLLLVAGVAGLQWKHPMEGMNIFFLLDRSDSVPPTQQEFARETANRWAKGKHKEDKAGFLVFGSEAALETEAATAADAEKIQAVVGTERTDLSAALRLGSAAFPENGQKRIVLLSDGNENVGDAQQAVVHARSQGVTVDVMPIGTRHGGDVAIQKLTLPSTTKKGATFEAKLVATSDSHRAARISLFRNDQLLGQQDVTLEPGKNLFTFPQKLTDAGFYGYQVQIDAPGDEISQNNKASGFTTVRGKPRLLLVSSSPAEDNNLAVALRTEYEVKLGGLGDIPGTLAEMQSFDAIFLLNVPAGDLGLNTMRLLESGVRDFGLGLVCVGGDNAFAAGGYRNTPLEEALPVDMELSSKKVLPSGALALVMHGMEFMNGNQVSRDIAIGALQALGPQDQMGVLLWDGTERWLFQMQKLTDKPRLASIIAGMNQGDLPAFDGLMQKAYEGLLKCDASLKHIIVFSDGDPSAPQNSLLGKIVDARITISTVMIGSHVAPDTMIKMAELGHGRFYDVKSAAQLPQIFIKEASIILKSAISEEPFVPQLAQETELIRGIGATYPMLRGYVATTAKPRAEVPLVTGKGDPLLAHWQFGLGRSVAFTSDAKSKWAQDWMGWGRYAQFWTQIASWVSRRVDASDFNTEVSVDNGEGIIGVEALDSQGNFRNFLNLQSVVVNPKGERSTISLRQTGPGRYEGHFPTREVGAYLLNLMELRNGNLVASQVVGASVNYSPEFNTAEPNISLLQRLAELGGGHLLSPEKDNPFLLGRQKTYQPRDLWEALLRCLVILFLFDVGVRRIDFDRDEWSAWWAKIRVKLGLGSRPVTVESEEGMAALLARKQEVRTATTRVVTDPDEAAPLPDLFASAPKSDDRGTKSPDGSTPAGGERKTTDENPGSDVTDRLLAAKRKARKKR